MIIIIGILAAIAIPMFLGQRDKAKEAAVKEGVHSIQIGIASYAVDNSDNYPTSTSLNDGTATSLTAPTNVYVDNWPKNPWTSAAMATNATTKGDSKYTNNTASSTYTLVGYGKTAGTPIISLP